MLTSVRKAVQLFFAGNHKIKPQHFSKNGQITDASSILLFFCISTKDELDNICLLLKKIHARQKRIEAFVFYPGYQSLGIITDKSIAFFNLNDFSLFANMNEKLERKVQESTFDLMISFCQSSNSVCHYLISTVNAGFRVGTTDSDSRGNYDLTINADIGTIGFEQYYMQVIGYLGDLNIARK